MHYLKSLCQARARDVSTNIKVRTTGNILRWETQFKHPLVSDSFLEIWSSLVNLMIELQACIDISFFKQPNVYYKSENQNQSKSREQDSAVCEIIKTKKAAVWLDLIVSAPKGIADLV